MTRHRLAGRLRRLITTNQQRRCNHHYNAKDSHEGFSGRSARRDQHSRTRRGQKRSRAEEEGFLPSQGVPRHRAMGTATVTANKRRTKVRDSRWSACLGVIDRLPCEIATRDVPYAFHSVALIGLGRPWLTSQAAGCHSPFIVKLLIRCDDLSCQGARTDPVTNIDFVPHWRLGMAIPSRRDITRPDRSHGIRARPRIDTQKVLVPCPLE
jgi:hypothetical protein